MASSTVLSCTRTIFRSLRKNFKACTGNPIAPGLTAAKVFIGTDGSGTPLNAGSAGTVVLKLITVRVSGYQLSYITKIFVKGGSKAFNDISVTMRQATT